MVFSIFVLGFVEYSNDPILQGRLTEFLGAEQRTNLEFLGAEQTTNEMATLQ